MDKDITVTISLREALAILTALMDLGLNRQHGREHLAAGEAKLVVAIFNASKPNTTAPGQELNDSPTLGALCNYEAGDNCL